MNNYNINNIAGYIDHTILKPDASRSMIEQLCREAAEHSFYSVCVNPCHVKFCANLLESSTVKVCSVTGFPLGAMHTDAKAFEASLAVLEGADEIDMVINIGALKEGRLEDVLSDMEAVRAACPRGIVLKVIIETCLLTDSEKKTACALAVKAGADFVKTSTGFSSAGAAETDVKLLKEASAGKIKIKASGRIKTYEDAVRMISAGADRLGTSSAVLWVPFKT